MNNHRCISAVLVVVAMFATPLPSARAEPPIPTEEVLRDAELHSDDAAYIARKLADFEVQLAATPSPRAIDFYTHGWLLAHAGRGADAVVAYDRAFAADNTLVTAAYNAGVVLHALGRSAEALAHFEAVLAVAPNDVDAAYNAGQACYDQKNFTRALELWTVARLAAPDDFDVVKKVLQAQNALADPKAQETREALIALRKASNDARVRELKEFCFDQFDVGKAHVLAYETLDVEEPRAPLPDFYALYTFKVTDAKDTIYGSVNLESSAAIREQGASYILGANVGRMHKTFPVTYTQRPSLVELRGAVTKVVKSEFAAVVGGH